MTSDPPRLILRSIEISLGFIFALAGLAKFSGLSAFAEALLGLMAMSERTMTIAAVTITSLELCVGFGLLLGGPLLRHRYVLLAGAMTILFSIALLFGELDEGCPCFGLGTVNTLQATLNRFPLLRNGCILLACAVHYYIARRYPSNTGTPSLTPVTEH